MSLLENFEDDIADLLGSDQDEPSTKHELSKGKKYKEKVRKLRQKNKEEGNINQGKKSRTAKKTLKQTKMLHSQSNQSFPSTASAANTTMSKEEALSLLHSESLKSLNQPTSKSVAETTSNAEPVEKPVNSDNDSDEYIFPETPHKSDKTDKNVSLSVSDDDSNDSILDWLDEPRDKTQRKRQPLLPKKAIVATTNKSNDITPSQTANTAAESNAKAADTNKITTIIENDMKDISKEVKLWKEWLALDENKKENEEFMHLAETAARTSLPDEWEKVNDNLYHNIKTNKKTMSHPLLLRMQNELKALRNKKEQKVKRTILQTANSIDLSLVNDHDRINVPLRQIATSPNAESSSTKMEQRLVPKVATNANIIQKEEGTSQNLRKEMNEIRKKYNLLLKEKTHLMEEKQDINNKTEIMLNEQRARLTQAHTMEISQLQKENDDLRSSNAKLMTEHQSKLINLEENCRKDGFAEKERRLTELSLMEERARKELGHQMELNRKTIDELKKQHLNEIEMLHNMHAKQLENFRAHTKNEGQLNFLISKMETSTLNLHRMQKDIEIERESNQKERESKISQKEKTLSEKDEELIREKKEYRELLERFKASVEETKCEKIRIRETEETLKKREEKLLCDVADSNREIHLQKDGLNEERRKLELCKSRWNKQKENELDDIQRLKNEHTKCIQTFYETQEMERCRLAKQRQILNDDKAQFIKIKKEFSVERDVLDADKLEFEQKKHSLQMEQNKFERKVQDVTALSHRVYQQSELVNKMYSDSKQTEHDNGLNQMQLESQAKEIKMMKQQILMEKNQIEKERKLLEEEQLSSLTAKRDLLQQIDSIQAMEKLNNIQSNTLKVKHNLKSYPAAESSNKYGTNYNLQKINSELKELKAFVNECKQNISNYKTDLNHLKHKRESTKSLSSSNHSHFNRMRSSFSQSSFPSLNTKSSSIRSVKSSLSTSLSSKDKSRINKSQNESINTINLSKMDITQTPIISKRNRSHLSAFNNTESTLQSSFVSMVNIDTPITIDNKTRKYMNKIDEQDPNLPLTPTPMPNLSKINVREEDNQDFDDSDDDDH